MIPHIFIPAERESELIAFACGRFSTDLYTIHPDGRQPRLIDENRYTIHSQLNWSPDGIWIALVKESYGGNNSWDRVWSIEPVRPEIYLIRFDGLASRRLTYNPDDVRSPRWSDDGRVIYFEAQGHSFAANHMGIVKQVDLSNQELSSPHTLASLSSQFSSDELASVSASPSGEWLAIVSAGGEHSAHGEWIELGYDESAFWWEPKFLYLQDMHTGQLKRFIFDVIHPGGVSWSPDGEWLAFAIWGKKELFKIRPDGTDLQQLTDMNCEISNIAWSPK